MIISTKVNAIKGSFTRATKATDFDIQRVFEFDFFRKYRALIQLKVQKNN